MSRTIQQSVGRNGANRHEDTKLVQQLLNSVPLAVGGPDPKLAVNGICDDRTQSAIFDFEFKNWGHKGADGRVEPSSVTLKMLQIYEETAEDLKQPAAIPEPPAAHKTAKFLVRPAVAKTPFGQQDTDWFFEVKSVPYQHTGIYYLQRPGSVCPLELPQRFNKKGRLVKTKFAHSPFDFSGDCLYYSSDRSGTQRDGTTMTIWNEKEKVEIPWEINHLIPMSNQTGIRISCAERGRLTLVRKLVNTATI